MVMVMVMVMDMEMDMDMDMDMTVARRVVDLQCLILFREVVPHERMCRRQSSFGNDSFDGFGMVLS